jgi:hypothetical protein
MRWLFVTLATLTLLAAAFLRTHQLHQYPPGPHYDEAAEVLITRSIAYGGAWYFPIVPEYQGREVLFYYLTAPLMVLIGDGVFTLRVANVFLNLLTISASIALGRATFNGWRGVVIGLTIGVLMTVNFPMIWLSRQAFRTGAQPLCQALALWCLWRGLRMSPALRPSPSQWGGVGEGIKRFLPPRSGWLIVGGIFAGLALYTYMASRLFPLWLLLGGIALLVIDSQNRGLRFRQGAVFFTALAITALPMAVYALQHPDIFMGRLAEVTQTDEAVTLETSIKRHLNMFFVEGETYLRYNIPGRPYFTRIEGYLLVFGLALALWRLFRTGRPTERAAYFLVLLSPLMVIPSVISVGGFPPNHMRSIGMVPLVFVLIGVGVETIVGFILSFNRVKFFGRGDLRGRSYMRPIIIFLTFSALVFFGTKVYQEYFAWAGRADLYYEADADLAAAARWLPAQIDENTRVYIGGRYREHPTLLIETLPSLTWLGTDSLFKAPEGKSGLYIFPNNAPPPERWLEWLSPGQIEILPVAPDEKPAFMAFRLPYDAPLPDEASLPDEPVANGNLTLIGVHTSPIFAGARGTITTDWRIDQTPAFSDLRPILQLSDEQGVALATNDPYLTDTDQWQPGEILFQRVSLQVPLGTPPGFYPISVTWASRRNGTLLPFSNGGISAEIGAVEVIAPAEFPDASALPIEQRQEHSLTPEVKLLGWNHLPSSGRSGQLIPMTLFWQGTAVDGERLTADFEILLCEGEDLQECAQNEPVVWQGAAGGENHPSDRWRDGELVTQHLRWRVPYDYPTGQYNIVIRSRKIQISTGIIDIVSLPRAFDPPPTQTMPHTNFAGLIELYGATLEANENDVQVSLTWKALHNISINYSCFLHLIDKNGYIIKQIDAMPVDNTYPTSLWQPEEFIADRYLFSDLPPGEYKLRLGWYDQKSGNRLPIRGSTGSDNYLDLFPTISID